MKHTTTLDAAGKKQSGIVLANDGEEVAHDVQSDELPPLSGIKISFRRLPRIDMGQEQTAQTEPSRVGMPIDLDRLLGQSYAQQDHKEGGKPIPLELSTGTTGHTGTEVSVKLTAMYPDVAMKPRSLSEYS